MKPIEYIRRRVFGLSQAAFASLAGTEQSTVSRWERGEREPDRDQMARIRAAAIERGLSWDDRWFFDTPQTEAA